MTRARELANFADDTAGLETLTVSDITDLSVSASNINSATNQITDSSTDLNVDSNTLVVDKSEDKVGILTASPTKALTVNNTIQIQDSATPSASAGTHLGHSSNNFSVENKDNGGTIFYNNGSETMRINSDGKVGIGATSGLLGKLHIQEFGSVAGSVSNGADTLVLQNNGGHGGLSVLTNNTSTASLHLGDTDSSTRGGLQYDNNTDKLSVLSGGAEKATIDSSGKVGIGTTSPDNPLMIENQSTTYHLKIIGSQASPDGDVAVLSMGHTNYRTNNNAPQIAVYRDGSGDHDELGMKFRVHQHSDHNAGPIDALTIDSDGKVGIGLTGPNAKLHVRESGLFTNAGTDGGSSYAPSTPILTVTTDGNGNPSGYYANNAVFKVGIGGGFRRCNKSAF